jgi:hypothetical protein
MIAATVSKFLEAAPFRPFTICVAGQELVEVGHPEVAILTAGGRILVVITARGELKHIDVLLITTVTTKAREDEEF